MYIIGKFARRAVPVVAALAVFWMVGGPARAATDTSPMYVSATVTTTGTCEISVGGLIFGIVDPSVGAGVATSVSLNCVGLEFFELSVDSGLNVDGVNFRMSDGLTPANFLVYSLEFTPDGGTTWLPMPPGNILARAVFPVSLSYPAWIDVQGDIPPQPGGPDGLYSDTLTWTVTF